MPKIRLLSDGTIPEKIIHKTAIEWSNSHAKIKGLVIHIPNEGRRSERYGSHLKQLGMRPGVSDLFIAMGRHGFYGAWIEIKSKNGKLSVEQQKFLEDMKQQNYFTAVCYDVDELLKTMEWYCLG